MKLDGLITSCRPTLLQYNAGTPGTLGSRTPNQTRGSEQREQDEERVSSGNGFLRA